MTARSWVIVGPKGRVYWETLSVRREWRWFVLPKKQREGCFGLFSPSQDLVRRGYRLVPAKVELEQEED